jgi:hypothetical protein
VGETQDVSRTGALGFMPVSKYPKEYDLLKRDGDNLLLGKRPSDNNMGSPEKRPRELTPYPVVKQRNAYESLTNGSSLAGDSTEAVPEGRLGRWAATRAAAS